MGKSTINGPFSIAMLNYQRVISHEFLRNVSPSRLGSDVAGCPAAPAEPSHDLPADFRALDRILIPNGILRSIIWGWVKTLVPSEHQNSWVKMDVHSPKNGMYRY